jgi:type I restriction enzyme S subunit
MTGTIPEGWKAVEIGSLIKVLGGFAFKSEDFAEHGSPVIRISNLSGNSVDITDCARIPQDKVGKGCRFKLEPGDTLIAMSGATTGKLGYVPDDLSDDWYLNQRVGAFRIRLDSPIDRGYFRLLLNSDSYQAHVWNLAAGAAQPNISGKQLESAVIPLPPLAEQKRIAAILDAADALRAKRRESLAQLDTLLQATFLDMFGDPVTNPKGWARKTLGEFINFVGGSQPPKDTFIYEHQEGYVRLVQIRDFKSDKYLTYIPQQLAKRPFVEEDVMVARYGPPVFQILTGLSGSYNVALMKAEPIGEVDKKFIFHLLNLPVVNAAVVAQSERTAGQSGVNLKFLNNYLAYLPPLDLQQHFATIVESIEQQKARLRDHLAELDTLFASLQQRAFNGNL